MACRGLKGLEPTSCWPHNRGDIAYLYYAMQQVLYNETLPHRHFQEIGKNSNSVVISKLTAEMQEAAILPDTVLLKIYRIVPKFGIDNPMEHCQL